ncbi:metallo-beta-lactamase [Porphyromonas crevioricanis]|uniref:Hydroxyacylglutathione hydrolase n=2 Tax=Porphyromonas crevioricanis TaxID=393921 RepID=A0A0A2FLU1_9PORP|nr:MBL fold metallo-hydrolase [Porphyromonas crevioricanis]KGN91000.1 metallo-beta-lactamase [Porphyromonas crevioricanis]SJZ55787.1 Glyoxylase, beta-lactamase superfamily II [Porphyromonas crevioricanis]SQH73332.1 hydroxyacylglutathione hydrolase [Porphyromonas crevioricanis]GAD06332.1 hydroxyacylglutathione hydrolase [Porphyromonas crevioricanis JCM 15906]GAD06695.1 hydroxyacylglutathione hydrolase [Porphyromonas crevioricanis JCM 13913]
MIEIQKFVFNEVFENTYVVWDTDTLETAIIDCGCMYPEEKTRLKDFIQSRKLKPTLLLNTHMHFDHCCGNSFVAEEWHLFPQTHRAEIEQMPTPSRQLELFGMQSDCPEVRVQYIDTDSPLKLGKHDVRVLFVPGHSPGHLAFYIPDAASVFVGDVLFLLEIGRCDLWGGSLPTLLQSARTQLFVLPPDTTVYCGHGPETSIGYEMENNPYFR